MNIKLPKNTERFLWTKHAVEKMRLYGLSESKVKGVIARPVRIEEGVAVKTTAVMQRTGSKKHPTEIWVMLQMKTLTTNLGSEKVPITVKQVHIISAWRYPGISKPREVPMLEDVQAEVLRSLELS